jgi:hypothetical protein
MRRSASRNTGRGAIVLLERIDRRYFGLRDIHRGGGLETRTGFSRDYGWTGLEAFVDLDGYLPLPFRSPIS